MQGYDELDAHMLRAMLGSPQLILIDVRNDAEVAAGTIPGARHIPLHMLPMMTGDLPTDGKLVFLCRSGARSAQACAYVASRGRVDVLNLRGGIAGWLQAGHPIDRRCS